MLYCENNELNMTLAFSPPRQRCREEKGEGTERKEEQNYGNVFSASYEVSSYKVLDCGYI